MTALATQPETPENSARQDGGGWPRQRRSPYNGGRYRETGRLLMPHSHRYSFIRALYELTGATDSEIAELLSLPRSTIQAYRTARLEENLTPERIEKILDAARRYRDRVYEAVAEMELYA